MSDSLSISAVAPAATPSGAPSLRLVTYDDVLLQRAAETAVELAGALLRRGEASAARDLLDGAGQAASALPDAAALRAALDDAWGQADDFAASALADADELTFAELRVLRFLPSYLTLGQIAGRLHVSTNTVKTQAHAVYRKLGVTSRSGAVERAAEIGLVESWPARSATTRCA
jgi:LuxR family transcriptional regulator, maltose regulon positive regulatory protein